MDAEPTSLCDLCCKDVPADSVEDCERCGAVMCERCAANHCCDCGEDDADGR